MQSSVLGEWAAGVRGVGNVLKGEAWGMPEAAVLPGGRSHTSARVARARSMLGRLCLVPEVVASVGVGEGSSGSQAASQRGPRSKGINFGEELACTQPLVHSNVKK